MMSGKDFRLISGVHNLLRRTIICGNVFFELRKVCLWKMMFFILQMMM
nr:MAG TPA: hypothetical protein [Caudoviricetes sp.]